VTYNEVKFVKEDVSDVMLELPEYNFYEMKEPQPNPYAQITLDKSILANPPAPKLVAPKAEFSKLENGLRIASIDRQGLTAHLGLYVNGGSRFETTANLGVSHMTSLMAFKSTAHLSHLRTVKTLEQLGANLSSGCTSGREEIAYNVEVIREFVPLAIPLIIGNVLFPRLLPWEVKATHERVKQERDALQNDPDAMTRELLHQAAFCNNTLGLSPLALERSVPNFVPDTVRGYMLDHFAPERMVLVGVNVEHAVLSKSAMRSFVDYNAIPLKERPAVQAQFTGGDMRADGPSPFCHLAVGVESARWGAADLAATTLLQSLLGGGSALSQSPGSGTLSRLTANVVRSHSFVEACSAFHSTYSDSGIFGVYGVSQPEHAGELSRMMTSNLKSLTTISEDELRLAKHLVRGRLLRNADNSSSLAEDLGQQVLMSNRYAGPSEFASILDQVTVEEAQAVARKLLSLNVALQRSVTFMQFLLSQRSRRV
jgi:processing peptidase subunit alpha